MQKTKTWFSHNTITKERKLAYNMSGLLHLYFAELRAANGASLLPQVVEDNARIHKKEDPSKGTAALELRRAMSTGSIGNALTSRWDTGTSCVEAPKVINIEEPDESADEEDDELNMEGFKWLTRLRRPASTGSLTSEKNVSALSRWDSNCVPNLKKDGAAKKPLRKIISKEEAEPGSPSSIKDVIRILDDADSIDRSVPKRIEIPSELFRAR